MFDWSVALEALREDEDENYIKSQTRREVHRHGHADFSSDGTFAFDEGQRSCNDVYPLSLTSDTRAMRRVQQIWRVLTVQSVLHTLSKSECTEQED